MEHRRSKGWERGVNLRDGATNDEDEAAFEWAVVSESETSVVLHARFLLGPLRPSSWLHRLHRLAMRPVDLVPARPELFR